MALHSSVAGLGTLGSNSLLELQQRSWLSHSHQKAWLGLRDLLLSKSLAWLTSCAGSWPEDLVPETGTTPQAARETPEMGVHSQVSDLRERGEEPPDDLISGGEVTPSFLQNVPGYTDHHCLMWEGMCRSLNTRKIAGVSCVPVLIQGQGHGWGMWWWGGHVDGH